MLQPVQQPSSSLERLESYNPRTGEKLGEVPVASPADVRAAVARARRAQRGWAAMGVDRRNAILNRLAEVLIARADEIASTVSAENGKPPVEPTGLIAPVCATIKLHTELAKRLEPGEKVSATFFVGARARIFYEPLGVAPGRTFDANQVAKIDGKQFRAVAERVFAEEMARATDPAFAERQALTKFLPKGEMELDIMVYQSVLGPIGLPAVEAVYAPLESQDGKPMNANHDYVIRMAAEDMPPVGAFWSMTLYDFDRGFFIPNDRKKYSVGENGGMKLAEDGSIEVHIAAEKPEGVPEENWLPISRKDEAMDVVFRIYAPDLEKFKTWKPPKAVKVNQ